MTMVNGEYELRLGVPLLSELPRCIGVPGGVRSLHRKDVDEPVKIRFLLRREIALLKRNDMVNNGVSSRLGGSRNCAGDAALLLMPLRDTR